MGDDPKKLIDFIERNHLGYLPGRVFISLVKSCEPDTPQEVRLAHLKEARNLLNIMIRRIK